MTTSPRCWDSFQGVFLQLFFPSLFFSFVFPSVVCVLTFFFWISDYPLDRTFADKFMWQAAAVGDLSTVRSLVEGVAHQKEHKHHLDEEKRHNKLDKAPTRNNMYVDSFSLDNRNDFGHTSLHISAMNGHLEVVEYLLLQGANAKLQTSHGLNAAHILAHKSKVMLHFFFLFVS